MKNFKSNVVIIGSGPAGLTAGIYAARAGLNPILLQGSEPGGQLTITTDVENYPGFADPIQGPWLMEQMNMQAKNVGVRIVSDYIIKADLKIFNSGNPFKLYDSSSNLYEAHSVIISTGATAMWLGLPSEEYFKGYGVSGCATCDAFFYKGKEVVVVGGGNTAVEEALYLTSHAKHVTLIHRRDSLRAEKILQNRLFQNPKISVAWNHVLTEIIGDSQPKNVTGIIIENVITKKTSEIRCDGVFIAIGHQPNTSLFEDQLVMDNDGYIVTEPNSTKTSIQGVFAAGDVQDKVYRQAVTAAGTGCMAALEAEKFLRSQNLE